MIAEQRFKLRGCSRRAFLAKSGHGARIAEAAPGENSPRLRPASPHVAAQKYLPERGEASWRRDGMRPEGAGVSGKAIPCSPASAVQGQMTLLGQRLQVVLDRVAAGAADPHGLGHRDPAVLARQLEDQHR